jgi:YVTN family beta-propeller protein
MPAPICRTRLRSLLDWRADAKARIFGGRFGGFCVCSAWDDVAANEIATRDVPAKALLSVAVRRIRVLVRAVAKRSSRSSTRSTPVTATVPVGKNLHGVAVDPGTHTVYVTNAGDNTVSVIDASTRTVTATVPVGKVPEGVAVDPSTHTVYVTNQDDGTVSVIDASTRTLTATVPSARTCTGWRWIRAPAPSTSPTSASARCR